MDRRGSSLEELPEHLICVGGGVIGMETASSFGKLGCKITVIELMEQLLPGTDPELVRPVQQALKKSGATIHLGSKATALSEKGGKAVLTCEGPKGSFEVVGDKVMVSIGFRPNSKGLGLEQAGVKVSDRGFVTVDPACRTNVGHIYAIGDVTGMPFLAHRATKMGVVAAEVIAGQPALCDWQAMPLGIFSDPEVAQVGLSEQEAKDAGHEVMVGKFPFAALGRAMAQNSTAGMVKVIGDAKSGILLGVGIVGPRANDLIAEAALALELGAAVETSRFTVHSHPTFAEGLFEAAEDALGHAIHVARPKRKTALEKQSDQLLLKKVVSAGSTRRPYRPPDAGPRGEARGPRRTAPSPARAAPTGCRRPPDPARRPAATALPAARPSSPALRWSARAGIAAVIALSLLEALVGG
ncbi:MAG: FAD-dependent oxidoreductase [Planctomycetota bacterium]